MKFYILFIALIFAVIKCSDLENAPPLTWHDRSELERRARDEHWHVLFVSFRKKVLEKWSVDKISHKLLKDFQEEGTAPWKQNSFYKVSDREIAIVLAQMTDIVETKRFCVDRKYVYVVEQHGSRQFGKAVNQEEKDEFYEVLKEEGKRELIKEKEEKRIKKE